MKNISWMTPLAIGVALGWFLSSASAQIASESRDVNGKLFLTEAGGVLTGPLSNSAGFFGDGQGLTNLNVASGTAWQRSITLFTCSDLLFFTGSTTNNNVGAADWNIASASMQGLATYIRTFATNTQQDGYLATTFDIGPLCTNYSSIRFWFYADTMNAAQAKMGISLFGLQTGLETNNGEILQVITNYVVCYTNEGFAADRVNAPFALVIPKTNLTDQTPTQFKVYFDGFTISTNANYEGWRFGVLRGELMPQ